MAVSPEKHGRSAGKFLLILCNIVLMLAAVLFTIFYSCNVRTSQEQLMRDNFCNTVETFKEISERYLAGELTDVNNWAAYIEQEHMSMDEALDYIRSVSDQTDCEAHFVDMDSFEARSTNTVSDSNAVGIYQKWFNESGIPVDDYILRMRAMYNGETTLLGKYTTKESGRTFISVGLRLDLRQEDGSERGYLLLRAVPIVYVVAGILLLIALIDGAYILSINHRLRATAEIAERASSAKTRFLSSKSHDIRTSLNAVLGMTELAQSHIGDLNYVQECLRKISMSGNHLLTLINDILDISRVESGRITVNPAPFSVRELVSELEGITRSQAVGHGLDFEVEFRDLPEPYLMGDRLRLTQVYLNLLITPSSIQTPAAASAWRSARRPERMASPCWSA